MQNGEIEMIWTTSITSKTHEYTILGGGYSGTENHKDAHEKAKEIRKKYTELKHGRIKSYRYYETELPVLDTLKAHPIGVV